MITILISMLTASLSRKIHQPCEQNGNRATSYAVAVCRKKMRMDERAGVYKRDLTGVKELLLIRLQQVAEQRLSGSKTCA
jgi:hypothetical protein